MKSHIAGVLTSKERENGLPALAQVHCRSKDQYLKGSVDRIDAY
jgi:hypothetical protein